MKIDKLLAHALLTIGVFMALMFFEKSHAQDGVVLYLDCIQDGEFTSTDLVIEEASQNENMNLSVTFKATLYHDGTAILWRQSFDIMNDLEGTHSDTEIDFSGGLKNIFGSEDEDVVFNITFNRINGEYLKTVEYKHKERKGVSQTTRFKYGKCKASTKTKF